MSSGPSWPCAHELPPTRKAGSAPRRANIAPPEWRPSVAASGTDRTRAWRGLKVSVGTRREARERAMSLLYEGEAKGLSPADVLEQLAVAPDPFVIDLVAGVGAHHDRIDELIARFAIDWTLERMPVIDRTLLRLAVYE